MLLRQVVKMEATDLARAVKSVGQELVKDRRVRSVASLELEEFQPIVDVIR
jgi:hypothetical protein